MSPPNQQDAALILQTAQWGAQIGLPAAMRTIMDDNFDPEAAELGDEALQTVLVIGETIGTLVKHDLLSRELVRDWLWVEGMWARVGPAAKKAREKFGEERLYENFEALASGA